jgi:hypothetical protein
MFNRIKGILVPMICTVFTRIIYTSLLDKKFQEKETKTRYFYRQCLETKFWLNMNDSNNHVI